MLDEKELVASKDNNNEWTYRAKANKLHAVKSKLDERSLCPRVFAIQLMILLECPHLPNCRPESTDVRSKRREQKITRVGTSW